MVRRQDIVRMVVSTNVTSHEVTTVVSVDASELAASPTSEMGKAIFILPFQVPKVLLKLVHRDI